MDNGVRFLKEFYALIDKYKKDLPYVDEHSGIDSADGKKQYGVILEIEEITKSVGKPHFTKLEDMVAYLKKEGGPGSKLMTPLVVCLDLLKTKAKIPYGLQYLYILMGCAAGTSLKKPVLNLLKLKKNCQNKDFGNKNNS